MQNVKSLIPKIFVFLLVFTTAVLAADYPTRPITFQVHSAAGGSTDVGMRLLCATAEKYIGQPMPVINKGGAGGVLAWTTLARSRPDGYMIGSFLVPNTPSIILDPERNVTFDLSDFVYIANHVFDPNVICVKNDSPYKTLKDLIEAAKANPGKISMGITALRGDDHILAVDFFRHTKTKFNLISMNSSAPLRAAVLGGHVEVYIGNQGDATTAVKEGSFRMLAIGDDKRSSIFPDVPTLTELGIPIIGASARGVAAPKGTPPEVIKALEAAFKKAVEDPDHIKQMNKVGLPLRFMGSEEYAKFVKKQYQNLKELLPSKKF